MTLTPDPEYLRRIHMHMHAVVRQVRLPFRGALWRGQTGNWSGVGAGSSIDFQDHRPYQLGDDPRYVDWNAYARCGQYIMKLYREEVSPAVDLVLDASPSMFFEEAKRERAWELFYFCVESALRCGTSLRCFLLSGEEPLVVEQDAALSHRFAPAAFSDNSAAPPSLAKVPWRSGALRVFVSDLLYPIEPGALLGRLSGQKGRAVVYAPHSAAEAEPSWLGNMRLIDCETGRRKDHKIDALVLGRYQRAYQRHFEAWREECRRRALSFARVPAAVPFEQALQHEAILSGAAELCI
jgi:uncharacterized protein (DUF58 family)